MRAELWGPDHQELGEIAVAGAGEDAAVALTRGRHPKTYGYTDPNEDCVAAVAGRRATLLVCADGHGGATAPVRAVEVVLATLGDDPPAALDAAAWGDLFVAAQRAVTEACTARPDHRASATVLLVALVAGGQVSWASMGDAALVVGPAGTARARQLNRETMRFVGDPMSERSVRAGTFSGTAPVAPGEWVVLVTDGLSEFVTPLRPADVVPRVLARAGDDVSPAGAARAIVEVAGEAGAGDNVGVALSRA